MDELPPIGLPETLEVVRELLEASFAATRPVSGAIVLLGGNALAAHGVRERSYDVDLFVEDVDFDVVEQVEKANRLRFGARFRLDVTTGSNAWGVLNLKDIADSPVVASLDTAQGPRAVRALRLDDLVLLKLLAARRRDVEDVALLSRRVDPGSLIVRFNQVLPWLGDRNHVLALADRVVFTLDNAGHAPRATIAELAVSPGTRAELEATWQGR